MEMKSRFPNLKFSQLAWLGYVFLFLFMMAFFLFLLVAFSWKLEYMKGESWVLEIFQQFLVINTEHHWNAAGSCLIGLFLIMDFKTCVLFLAITFKL